MGLGFKLLQIGPPSTTVTMCKTMDVLNNEKASEETPLKTNSLLTFEHKPNNTTKLDTHISISNSSPFKIDDEIPTNYHKLLDWDQFGPLIFDQFNNDDTLIIDFEIYDGIKVGDHKEAISSKVNTLAYFRESIPSSRCKVEHKENMTRIGLLVKTKRCH